MPDPRFFTVAGPFTLEHLAAVTSAEPACCMDGTHAVREPACFFDAPDLAFMPHKYNADRRHHISRPKRRVTNWSDYNEALRQLSAELCSA